MFKAPFSSEGRIRRTEFWITYLIYTILVMIIETFVDKNTPILYIAYFPLLWLKLAQGATSYGCFLVIAILAKMVMVSTPKELATEMKLKI